LGTIAAALAMTLTSASVPAGTPVQAAGPARVVRAVCCKCVDGSKQTAPINTGTAPWRVTAVPTGTTGGLGSVVAASNAAWTTLPPASWVGPQGAPTKVGDYTYELTIVVPRCAVNARAMSIEGRFAADNKATVFFNNTQIAVSQGATNLGFQAASVTPFTVTGLTPGTHTLKIVVYNMSSVTALAVQGQVTTACPSNVEMSSATASASKEALACACDSDKKTRA
jgi:hypothetical protein